MKCQIERRNHSKDVVEIYHGATAPMYLCGYHLTSVGVNDAAKEIAELGEQRATCAQCGAEIIRYGVDGIWFTSALGGTYSCTAGALHTPAAG